MIMWVMDYMLIVVLCLAALIAAATLAGVAYELGRWLRHGDRP